MKLTSGIREFHVANFKSYRDASLKLSPLTLLIGPNASGKSNLVESVRLLSWLARGKQLDEILRAVQDRDLAVRGSPGDLTHDEGDRYVLGCSIEPTALGAWTELRVELAIARPGMRIVSESIQGGSGSVPLYRLESPADG